MMTKAAMRIDDGRPLHQWVTGYSTFVGTGKSLSMRAQLTLCCRSWAMDHLYVNLKSEIRLDYSLSE